MSTLYYSIPNEVKTWTHESIRKEWRKGRWSDYINLQMQHAVMLTGKTNGQFFLGFIYFFTRETEHIMFYFINFATKKILWFLWFSQMAKCSELKPTEIIMKIVLIQFIVSVREYQLNNFRAKESIQCLMTIFQSYSDHHQPLVITTLL